MIAGLLLWVVAASDTSVPDKLYASGQFEQAAAIYSKLVQQAPRDVPLLLRLGATDYQLGLFPEAETQAAQLAPSDRMARQALAHAYQETNNLFQGEPLLKALVAADPGDAESWYYLGALLFDSNYYPAALNAPTLVPFTRPTLS